MAIEKKDGPLGKFCTAISDNCIESKFNLLIITIKLFWHTICVMMQALNKTESMRSHDFLKTRSNIFEIGSNKLKATYHGESQLDSVQMSF